MLRYALLTPAFLALVTACETEADLEAWQELTSDASLERAAADAGSADAADASAVASNYECTYKCDNNGEETTTVSSTSTAAAEQIIYNNADGDGDGINDYCPNGDVRKDTVDCELAD